jgi:hypothetical protein
MPRLCVVFKPGGIAVIAVDRYKDNAVEGVCERGEREREREREREVKC